MDYYFIDDSLHEKGVKNVIRVKDGKMAHFQIEKKNGMTYMRFKRRRVS